MKFLLNHSKKIFFILLFIYTVFCVVKLGIIFNISNWQVFRKKEPYSPNCKEYGRDMPIDAYVRDYTVKSGDSLLSIAKNELGSSERLYELISYNKTNPDVIFGISNIKVGVKLKIPKKDLGVIRGKLMKKAGKINSIDGSSMGLINAAANRYDGFPLSPDTLMIGKSKFEKDDCVVALLDTENEYSIYRTISIELQKQKN